MKNKTKLLPDPIRPGLLRKCSRCHHWFALKREGIRIDSLLGKVTSFRCKRCGCVLEFASSLPKGAI